MNEVTKYILEQVRVNVWSGFSDPTDVHRIIDDLLEEGADESYLRSAVELEFDKKLREEESWPETTDCDRLDQAFATLNAHGIIALQNAGYTMSDGITEVSEVIEELGADRVRGYCFFHGQDVERAVEGGGLMVAFGDLESVSERKAAIGSEVKSVLESCGLVISWNGDPETRIEIPALDWKRRTAS